MRVKHTGAGERPDHLERLATQLGEVPAFPERRPVHREISDEERSYLENMGFSDTGRPWQDVVEDLTQRILPNSMNMAHPRFFAFIPSAPLPSAWLVDATVSAYNPFSGSWLQGSGPAAIELATIDLLRRQVGLPETAGGVFLSGGSIANMTALTAARTSRLSQDAWPDAIAYVTSEAHSSVRKGLRFIGVPDANVRTIAVDDAGRMIARALKAAIEQDLREGRHPFAVTATFGTTNTGAIDPIAEIAEVASRYGVWLHVDGAYGATIAFSAGHRDEARDLEFADSLSWDPHKWLFQTYVSSCLLVRDRRSLLDCFRTQADYLRDAEADPRKPNYWDYGPEMTRPARAVRLWATLQVLGRRELAAAIDHCVALAEVAADRLGALPDWRVTSPPQLGILTFRYAPEGYPAEELDAVNAAVSRTVFESGFAAVLTTRLNGRTVLRLCTSNPNTTREHVLETIERLDAEAGEAVSRG